MKKIKIILTAIMMCGLLAGCGKAAEETQTTTETAEQTTIEVTETATTEGVTEEVTTEALTTEETPKIDYTGKTTLTYIGHAAVKLVSKDGVVIYIDPAYQLTDDAYTDEADIVLVTHGHDDHIPCDKLVKKSDCQVITWREALHDGVYETYTIGDNITIEAVKSGGNGNHKMEECVGYVVTIDGVKVYHAGDTSKNDWMSEFAAMEIDYAMFPIDGIYNMGPSEATKAAALVGAKNNIPIHEYDDVMSGKKKSDKFNPEGKLVIEYGETIVIAE